MKRWLKRRWIFAAVGFVALVGCKRAPDGPEIAEAVGSVTWNGSPVEGATVMFAPADGGAQRLSSQAVTDASGIFVMTTHVGAGNFKPGVVPGKYEVGVTKLDTASIKSTMGPPKNVLPNKYANAKSSGLTAEVVAGRVNKFTFSLEGK